MATDNPYAPPSATVADVADAQQPTQPVRVFSSRGRIGRLRFLCYLAVSYFAMTFGFGAAAGLAGVAGLPFGATLTVILLLAAFYIWLLILWGIQRSHDMGWSGWTSIGVLVPFLGLLWLLIPGTAGPNRFGPPPPPNGTGVVVGALLFPLLFVIGIVAAVALPAYQDYAKRAATAKGT